MRKRHAFLPPEDAIPFRGPAHGRNTPTDEAEDPGLGQPARNEEAPGLAPSEADATVRVENGEPDALDRAAVGFQLEVRPTAGRRESYHGLGRCLHFDRKGELSAQRHQVEPERTGGPDDEERLFDESLELGAFREGKDAGVRANRIRLALEQAPEFTLVA